MTATCVWFFICTLYCPGKWSEMVAVGNLSIIVGLIHLQVGELAPSTALWRPWQHGNGTVNVDEPMSTNNLHILDISTWVGFPSVVIKVP